MSLLLEIGGYFVFDRWNRVISSLVIGFHVVSFVVLNFSSCSIHSSSMKLACAANDIGGQLLVAITTPSTMWMRIRSRTRGSAPDLLETWFLSRDPCPSDLRGRPGKDTMPVVSELGNSCIHASLWNKMENKVQSAVELCCKY
jgi:hypothetical protein